MKSALGSDFVDLAKALDGWFGMINAFRLQLREEFSSNETVFAFLQAIFGCAVLIFVTAILSISAVISLAWLGWKFSRQTISETFLQRRWQTTNETSTLL